ncbi:AAA family ATPase [Methylobacter sp.]|uniref:AAA family ATPase n=1 Tax=Methylobacter sp. TaxID=2051955 RepID=UPI003DA31152
MAEITAINIRNLRSLRDTGNIKIKPITVLVGRNSAGKSTFARSFPLFRQSVEEKKRAPILWYGRLVDFGGFKDALNRDSDVSEIEFGFEMVSDIDTKISSFWSASHLWSSNLLDLSKKEKTNIKVKIIIRQDSNSQNAFASKLELIVYGNKISIELHNQNSVNTISVNGDNVWTTGASNVKAIVNQGKIIPTITFAKSRRIKRDDNSETTVWATFDLLFENLVTSIFQYVHGNTSRSKVLNMINSIVVSDDSRLLESLKSIKAGSTWRQYTSTLNLESKSFIFLKNRIYASLIIKLIESIDDGLANYFLGVKYLEPLRATAQRYYRRQELAIDEIDSKGTNVAMFLDSLTEKEKQSFEAWMAKHFKVIVGTSNEGGHISLNIAESKGAPSTNLADMGFGFSQLLPIAVQLWSSIQTKGSIKSVRQNKTTCIVVEQPELHLHPEYQARIADVMVATIKGIEENKTEISIIAETHSPNIVNRLGQLVEEGVINESDVQVVLFENSNEGASNIRVSNFNSEGVLQDWPYGFFEVDGY